jgi:hypothetical protein
MDVTMDSVTRMLARTPPMLTAWLRDLPEPWMQANEGPDTFTPWDVLGHLLQGEQTDWIPRAQRILEHGTGRPFDPFERRAHRTRFSHQSGNQLLDEFTRLRAENLETLRAWRLDDERLARRGLHPELGDVTLRELLATWVVHDLGHIAQIARVMAKQLREEVGPWEAYLPVLHDRLANQAARS